MKMALGLGLLVGVAMAAGPQESARLLVANQQDHTLSVIDAATDKQVAAIDVQGITGHEVAASPDGKMAFVPIYGNSGVGKPGTDGDKIQVIDLDSRKIVHTIQFDHGVRPHLPVFDHAGKVLYVTTELDHAITAFDPKTYARLYTVPTGEPESHMFAVSHDDRWGYTANVGSGTVSVLDLPARKTVVVIPISANTQRISISNDDSMVFTADQTQPRLAVIDTATRKIRQWVVLPGIGYGTAPTRDGRWLLVALRDLHKVAVVDLKTMQVARTLDMPGVPVEVLVRPEGARAYVSCGKQVAVIDTAAWKLEPPLEAGVGADGLAWAR